jgi:UDP-N-acetylmuramoyl-tripeptide--D-alanyl-D-alanine ligase
MIQDLYKRFVLSTGISTDTRKIEPGNIFFALKGPNFNANKFAQKALSEGASLSVVDEKEFAISPNTLLVKNVLHTLQDLANYHRHQLKIPVIGITGSNGKTTTKELIRAVLSEKYKCQATEGNLNNHIGVPLTILSLQQDTEIAIIEMGANKLGDINELCRIAEPTQGIITNIGKAHTEGFGSFEGVLRGKSELYHWLIQNNGTVFINSEDAILMNMSKRFEKPILYPGPGDYYHCNLIEANPWVTIEDEEKKIIKTQLIGRYNYQNIAAALCIGKYFEVNSGKASSAVAQYIPTNNRSQILSIGTNTIILDAYNANPDSMSAAIQNLSGMEGKNKVLILGDMFELGDLTEVEHRRIGELTLKESFDKVIFCGERMQYAHQGNRNSRYFKSRTELENYIESCIFEDSLILIKGSRGMALEVIAQKIRSS